MKFDNHYCSDIEPYCQELYKLRFPDSIQLGDITKIKTEDLPGGEWIITGGFPCQDISIAGKGEGIHGERSGLWFEYWRIIRDLRPRFAIMENVGMLVHRGLREVLGSLAEIGYNAEWQDIRASDMGAPHKRERIWILAYPESLGRFQNKNEVRDSFKAIKNRGCLIDSIYASVSQKNAYSRDFRILNDLPTAMDRLRGLGNAIVPQIAELLFNQIKRGLND